MPSWVWLKSICFFQGVFTFSVPCRLSAVADALCGVANTDLLRLLINLARDRTREKLDGNLHQFKFCIWNQCAMPTQGLILSICFFFFFFFFCVKNVIRQMWTCSEPKQLVVGFRYPKKKKKKMQIGIDHIREGIGHGHQPAGQVEGEQ
jgi:hypothetical protein